MKDQLDIVVTPLTDPADPGFLALEEAFWRKSARKR